MMVNSKRVRRMLSCIATLRNCHLSCHVRGKSCLNIALNRVMIYLMSMLNGMASVMPPRFEFPFPDAGVTQKIYAKYKMHVGRSVHLTSVKSTETSMTCHTQLMCHINLHTPLPCVMC